MAKRKSAIAVVLGMLGVAISVGCTVDRAKPTALEEADQRRNLREVRGSIDQFKTDVGDPAGLGRIPSGR